MGFYEQLSKVYDIVFPFNQSTLSFLEQELKAKAKVMDVACGTGTYALALAEKGHLVYATDLDSNMIKLAKEKQNQAQVHFAIQDMRYLGEAFPKVKYDLIYCIGNSLVHLPNREEIGRFFHEVYTSLEAQGSFIFQIVNYDRIIENHIQALPTIEPEGKGVTFIRKYEYEKEKKIVHFNTTLRIKENGQEESYFNSIPLLALQSGEIKKMLEKAGFQKYEFYGNFLGEKYDKEAFATIVRAKK